MTKALLIAALILLAACADDDDENIPEDTATPSPSPSPDGHRLTEGVLATFDVTGEHFKVWATDPGLIEQLRSLDAGESTAGIPNGTLVADAGEADYNAPWGWHLEDVEMAEVAIEVCDGRPSYVEEHIEEFIDQVGRYCPWSAELVGLEELGDSDGEPSGTASREEIAWREAQQLLKDCHVVSVMQTHALDIYLMLDDGTEVHAKEPGIDDISRELDSLPEACRPDSMATE